MFGFLGRHKIFTGILVFFLVVVVGVTGFLGYRMKGPYRSYRLDFTLPAAGAPAPGMLEVGVAMRDITPDLTQYDPWEDVDGDGRYKPDKGDTYTDRNGNGRFDTVWMAGFNNNRPAQGVNDRLDLRAIAMRNNGVTVAMVTLDSIGIFHEKFIEVRKAIDPALGVDHVVFSCLHNHEAPDTMGIWSFSPFNPLFDDAYLARVKEACKEAVEDAVRGLQPAEMRIVKEDLEPEGFVDDSRKPTVYDRDLCVAHFTKPDSDESIATLVSWGNHVETLGGSNVLLTADFPHWLREGVEFGVDEPNGVEGLGGMCLYFQGSIGGLMTQLHTTVPHRDGERMFEEDSFEKAEALGENLAIRVVNAVRSEAAIPCENPQVAVAAKTFLVPMTGLFKYAIMLGLIHPGYHWGGKARTEINALQIGDLEILTIPGEIYPEIVDGGIESPEGADFPSAPIEVPPLRGEMRGKVNMVFNLANDEIGYIIPSSQWDTEPPYAYGPREKPQYGEENSLGPDTAPIIHKEALEVLAMLHGAG
jgi:hypothetical protein